MCGLYFENQVDQQEILFSSSSSFSVESNLINKEEIDGLVVNYKDYKNVDENIDDEIKLDSVETKYNQSKVFEYIINRLKYRWRSKMALQETIKYLSILNCLFDT